MLGSPSDEELRAAILQRVEGCFIAEPEIESRIINLLPSLGLYHWIEYDNQTADDSRSLRIMPKPPWAISKKWFFIHTQP